MTPCATDHAKGGRSHNRPPLNTPLQNYYHAACMKNNSPCSRLRPDVLSTSNKRAVTANRQFSIFSATFTTDCRICGRTSSISTYANVTQRSVIITMKMAVRHAVIGVSSAPSIPPSLPRAVLVPRNTVSRLSPRKKIIVHTGRMQSLEEGTLALISNINGVWVTIIRRSVGGLIFVCGCVLRTTSAAIRAAVSGLE
jgi:hypothetical protein